MLFLQVNLRARYLGQKYRQTLDYSPHQVLEGRLMTDKSVEAFGKYIMSESLPKVAHRLFADNAMMFGYRCVG